MGQRITIVQHTVLIVDDDAIIRYELLDFLEDKGFFVLDANNADGAIALMETHPEIGAVLTDVQMPGSMDEPQTGASYSQPLPPAALFIISGQREAREGPLPEHTRFYSKPIDTRALLRDLRTALN